MALYLICNGEKLIGLEYRAWIEEFFASILNVANISSIFLIFAIT